MKMLRKFRNADERKQVAFEIAENYLDEWIQAADMTEFFNRHIVLFPKGFEDLHSAYGRLMDTSKAVEMPKEYMDAELTKRGFINGIEK